MSATATCPACGKVLRRDYRPGEQPERDLSPREDCHQCEVERRKLDVAQVVAARVPVWKQEQDDAPLEGIDQ